MTRRGEDLGPREGLSAEALAGCAADWLSARGFLLRTRIRDGVITLEAVKNGWADGLTGRRKMLVLRLEAHGSRWRGEAKLQDLRHNLAFAAGAALMGPVGWAGATVSAVSRLWDPDWIRDLFAVLRARLQDGVGNGPRVPEGPSS